jgi:predicted nucleotidyltransferase
LITQTPQNFKGGGIWGVIVDIHNAMMAVGLGLLVLFFVVGMAKTCSSFAEIKRPEVAFKIFVRFVLAKLAVTRGMELLLKLFEIAQGLVTTVMKKVGINGGNATVLPDEIVSTIESVGFIEKIPLWAVTLIGSLFITVLSFVMIWQRLSQELRRRAAGVFEAIRRTRGAGASAESACERYGGAIILPKHLAFSREIVYNRNENGVSGMVYTIDELKRKIAPIAEKYQLPAVYLFGSYARGDATDDSDVDVLFNGRGSKIHGFLLGALYDDLQASLEKELDLIDEAALEQPEVMAETPWFLENIFRERMQIYG